VQLFARANLLVQPAKSISDKNFATNNKYILNFNVPALGILRMFVTIFTKCHAADDVQ